MRQSMGQKKVNRIRRETGLDVLRVLVRGGTDHRKDLCIRGGKVIHLYKDGTMKESQIKWNYNKG